MGLFADYFPSHIEWINDSSCKPPPQRDSGPLLIHCHVSSGHSLMRRQKCTPLQATSSGAMPTRPAMRSGRLDSRLTWGNRPPTAVLTCRPMSPHLSLWLVPQTPAWTAALISPVSPISPVARELGLKCPQQYGDRGGRRISVAVIGLRVVEGASLDACGMQK